MDTEDILYILENTVGIKFTACNSSNLICYGYNRSEHTLWICFKGEKVYSYPGITPSEVKDLEAAESKGKWVNANLVKPKRHCEAYEIR